MIHVFDVEIATEYGVNAAIILEHLNFWIAKNEANENNFHDGYYWTYNSIKAFNTLMPYLSERKIREAINKLSDDGIIITGNFNKSAYDRTMWYAITQKGKSILQKRKMESDKMSNQNIQNVKPIPDIIPYKIPDSKHNNKKVSKKAQSYDEIINSYTQNETLKTSLVEFVKMRSLNKRQPLTSFGLSKLLNKLDKLGKTDAEKVEIVDQSVMRGWAGFFEVKQDKNSNIIPMEEYFPDNTKAWFEE